MILVWELSNVDRKRPEEGYTDKGNEYFVNET